jgi:hypothetical protein
VPLLQFLLRVIPGVLLGALTILFGVGVILSLLQNPHAIFSLILLGLALAVLWSMWMKIPQVFRTAIYRMLKRRREGDDGRRS